MQIPVTFGLIGLLTGVLTLVVIFYIEGGLYSAGFLFAAGLGLGTWLAQQRVDEKIAAARVVGALLPIGFGFLVLVWLLLAVYGVVQFLLVLLDTRSAAPSSLPIGYWIGLLNSGVAGAAILWTSLRLLPVRAGVNLLWSMVGASLLVCGITIAVDGLIVGYYGFPLHSQQREWANWTVLFLMGNTLMSFLYGIGIRGTIVHRGLKNPGST